MKFFWNKKTAAIDIEKPSEQKQYSFCETVTAGGGTPWHIRKLTGRGRMLSGGADTRSLCGREVSWDIKVEISERQLGGACANCTWRYRDAQNG